MRGVGAVVTQGLLCLWFSCQSLALVDEPAACLRQHRLPCAIRATRSGERFSWDRGSAKAEIVAAAKTSWILNDDGIQLLEGQVWVRASEGLNLQTMNISFSGQGEFWVRVQGGRTEVRNLQAELTRIRFRSINSETNETGHELMLPVGFENWYSGLDTTGQYSVGVLRPINRDAFFRVWAADMRVSKTLAAEKIRQWKEVWQSAAQASSDLYAHVVQRKLAEVDRRLKAEKQKRQQEADERLRLRQMFRARNGFQD